MAASFTPVTNSPRKMLAVALLLISLLANEGVTAQEEDAVTGPPPTVTAAEFVRDMIPTIAKPPEGDHPQVLVFPSVGVLRHTEHTTVATSPAAVKEAKTSTLVATQSADGDGTQATSQGQTQKPVEPETPAYQPARGDGPNNIPKPIPQDDVVCVTKEAIQHQNAISLTLKKSSNCEDTRSKISSVVQELCGEDCKLEIFQENDSKEVLVSGPYVKDDVKGMADGFNNDNIKHKIGVEEVVPHWGKNSKLVLVSLLLTGLLLAALLVAGYYFKTHRKNSKGVRLAESFQVDEENQANTLVSVAPLPQEPLDKPTVNGESPPENGTPLTTNGHSATQTPVADTEM
ncbi:hematopoietic progenitor cell antigen CD34 [Thalassophryne amazonica]|uniref:hematopoietic progenitor cell antigen CD34 n=1 Tax=Thalassophryne amazonica TaxID=390379 RepID=UPI0014718373|nr:hematopoietic progenitor cell antigen CD34 [Thalassophryne amazonica]